MPYTVQKHGRRYAIVHAVTGKVVGHSDTKRKAHISASIRNRADKPTKG